MDLTGIHGYQDDYAGSWFEACYCPFNLKDQVEQGTL